MAKKYQKVLETLPWSCTPSDFDTLATTIIKDMEYLIDKFGDEVYLDYDYSYFDGGSGTYTAMRRRDETDEERDARLAKRRKERKQKKEDDAEAEQKRRKLYHELKKEFGDE